MRRTLLWFLVLLSVVLLVPALVSAQCTNPSDDLSVATDITLCSGTFSVTDSGADGIIKVNASGITVSCNGTIISGSGSGLGIASTAVSSSNAVIANCTIRNFASGIVATNGAWTVQNNTVQNTSTSALSFGGNGAGSTAIQNTINNLSAASTAIQCNSDMNISQNTLTNTRASAIGCSQASNITISQNSITSAGGGGTKGIDLQDVNDSVISSNNISSASDQGIRVRKGSDAGCYGLTFQNNIVSGATFTAAMHITDLYDSVLTQNTFNGSSDGVVLSNSTNVNLTFNGFLNNSNDGLDLNNASEVWVDTNNITGNGANGLDTDPGVAGTNIQDSFVVNNNISFNTDQGIAGGQNGDKITFGNNTVSNNFNGFDALGSNDVVINNTIANNGEWGISLASSNSVDQILDSNTVSLNTNGGIRLTSEATGVTIRFNTIQNNNATSSPGSFVASLAIANISGVLYDDDPFSSNTSVMYWLASGDDDDIVFDVDGKVISWSDGVTLGVDNLSVAVVEWNTSAFGDGPNNSTLVFLESDWGSTCAAFNATVSGFGVPLDDCIAFKTDFYVAQGTTSNYTIDTGGINFSNATTWPITLNYVAGEPNTVHGLSVQGNGATIYNNTITDNSKSGIFVGANDSVITNNTIEGHSGNSAAGIYLDTTANNISVYNNYLNNTNNSYDNGTNNLWNTSNTSTTNILGGSNIGGNFYSDYAGIDSNSDGFGDTNYTILNNGEDALPLTSNACSIPVDNLVINTNTTLCAGTFEINDSAGDGIVQINGSNIVLTCSGTTIIGNGSGRGITDEAAGASSQTGTRITGCTVSDYADAIRLAQTSDATISSNTMANATELMTQFSSSSGWVISGNTFIGGSGSAITLQGSHNHSITGNTFNRSRGVVAYSGSSGNNITDNTFYNASSGSGDSVNLNGVEDTLVENNTFRYGGSGSGAIVVLSQNRTIIRDNTLEFVSTNNAIALEAGSDETIVQGNNITNNSASSALSLANGVTNITIANNSLTKLCNCGTAVDLTNVSGIIFHNNSIEPAGNNHGLRFTNSSGITLTNNTINGTSFFTSAVTLHQTDDTIVSGNTFRATGGNQHTVYVNNSNNVTISNNTLDTPAHGIIVFNNFNVTINESIINSSSRKTLIINDTTSGAIAYNETVTFTNDVTLNDVVTIGTNSIFVNSSAASALNASALLKFLGVGFTPNTMEVDLEDDGTFAECGSSRCSQESFGSGTATAYVTSFTTYRAGNATDSTNPNVTSLVPTAGSSFNTSNSIELAATVTDDNTVDTVYANVTLPNGTVSQVTLTNASNGDEFNSTFSIPVLAGQYNVTFFANDTSGNANDTETTTFNASIPACTTPTNDLNITTDTTLCSGTYSLSDTGAAGVIAMNTDNVDLTCNNTILTGSGSGVAIAITSGTQNVVVQGCTLRNYAVGINDTSTTSGGDSTFGNNTIQNMSGLAGIYLGAHRNRMENNTLKNTTHGIRNAFGFANHTVVDNTINVTGSAGNTYGIILQISGNNLIDGNTILNVDYGGMLVQSGLSNNITNNIITSAGTIGIQTAQANSTRIEGNNISGSGTYEMLVNGGQDLIKNNRGSGSQSCITLQTNDTTVRDNTCLNMSSSAMGTGDEGGGNSLFINNTITNATFGFSMGGGSDDITIANNTISQIVTGFSISLDGTTTGTISGNLIQDSIALRVRDSSGVNVTSNIFNNLTAGEACLKMDNAANLRIISNTLYNCSSGKGILLQESVNNTLVDSNNITTTNDDGIELEEDSSSLGGLDNTIVNNIIIGAGSIGVEIKDNSLRILVGNNTIRNSSSQGILFRGGSNGTVSNNSIFWGDDKGVEIDDEADNTIVRDNQIYNNSDSGISTDTDDGDIGPSQLQILNNNLSYNGGSGIELREKSQGAIIDNNTIVGSTSHGIEIIETSNVTIRYNTITNHNDSAQGYLTSASPGTYNGINFTEAISGSPPAAIWLDASVSPAPGDVRTDNTTVTVPNGVTNISVYLAEMNVGNGLQNFTAFFPTGANGITSCSTFDTALAFLNPTCFYTVQNIFSANGVGQNYTYNGAGVYNVSSGLTSPPYLILGPLVGTNGIDTDLDSKNITIYNNTIRDGNGSGVSVDFGNVTITNNTISNQSTYGIELASGSETNSVYNNYLNNTNNTRDDGSNNDWNTSKTAGTNIIGGANLGGNFYSDYTGTDSDGDGLGEQNYTVPPSSVDLLPLTNADGQRPNVTNLVPSAGTIFNITTIELAANVTDNEGVSTVYVNVTYPNGTVSQITLTNASGGEEFNNTFTIPALFGQYNLTFFANDTNSNTNTTETSSFNATGTFVVINSNENTTLSTGTTTETVNASIGNNASGISNVSIKVNSLAPANMTLINGFWIYNVSGLSLDTTHTFILLIEDGTANVTNYTFTLTTQSASSGSSSGGGGGGSIDRNQCNDKRDNDGDGLRDYPSDPGCRSPSDDSENSDEETITNPKRDSDPVDLPDSLLDQGEEKDTTEAKPGDKDSGEEEPTTGQEDDASLEEGEGKSAATVGFIAVTLAIILFAAGYYYFGRKPPVKGVQPPQTPPPQIKV